MTRVAPSVFATQAVILPVVVDGMAATAMPPPPITTVEATPAPKGHQSLARACCVDQVHQWLLVDCGKSKVQLFLFVLLVGNSR
jgi:hypothetical protein